LARYLCGDKTTKQNKNDMDCGSAFKLDASGFPYYCTPPVNDPDVIGAQAMWRQIFKNNLCNIIPYSSRKQKETKAEKK